MRLGFRGALISADRAHNVPVLYSLHAQRGTGRLRPVDPAGVFPAWVAPGTRVWLQGDDGLARRVRITKVKCRREGWRDDDHFAEYVTAQVDR